MGGVTESTPGPQGVPFEALVPAGSTSEYREARLALLDRERALRAELEAVAAARRGLPSGPIVENYRFEESSALGDVRRPRLTDLFGTKDTLVLYHLMFSRGDAEACPMCSMWVDGFHGVQQHLDQHTAFAVSAGADVGALRAWSRRRGWDGLRLVSSGGNSLNKDLGAETTEGSPRPTISVMYRDEDDVRLHYTMQASFPPDGAERGIDLLSPVWQILDLLPSGRREWYAGNDYSTSPRALDAKI